MREQAVPRDVRQSLPALKKEAKRFHGAKFPLAWFPASMIHSPCANHFGYMSTAAVRNASKLAFLTANVDLLNELGALIGDAGRETAPESSIPSGYTYFGQFVDHDITLDVSSTIDAPCDANLIPNMRTPALDLDSVYGRGPALDPFLYEFPSSGPPTAVKMKLGVNTNSGPGGASDDNAPSGMNIPTTTDVPRVSGTNTAIIGDPRNDENLIVSQFHQTMLRFHNKVVDLLVAMPFPGDIFVEARKTVTHHYQWAVVHDFLKRIAGASAVTNALATVAAPVGSAFRMPVEFAAAAYRFGHSQIRDVYWVNHGLKNQSLGDVFAFIRAPRLPVFSNWVIDFNAFFETGISVPIFNRARKIDSVLANGLEFLPGFSGMMAELASRNLRRGLAFGLPSGQALASAFGITPMTTAQMTAGLPASELTILSKNGGILLSKSPLWYYVLREAAVVSLGEKLGPLGARVVTRTFVRMLKRDAGSFLNTAVVFSPFLPSAVPGDFTVVDLIKFAGAHLPS